MKFKSKEYRNKVYGLSCRQLKYIASKYFNITLFEKNPDLDKEEQEDEYTDQKLTFQSFLIGNMSLFELNNQLWDDEPPIDYNTMGDYVNAYNYIIGLK